MRPRFSFRNLVFHGGGSRTFAYHGVLPVLEQAGVLSQIDRVGGTSAGAMTAAWVSFRLSAADTIALYDSLDFSQIPVSKIDLGGRFPYLAPVEDGLGRIAERLLELSHVVKHYGMHQTSYPHSWMTDTIASQCGGDGRATFSEFRRRGFRDLSVVTTNMSTHKIAVFSADTTPDVAVVDALLLSQSVPLFFEAPQFDGKTLGRGDFYGDGGLLNNYPLHLFDHARYADGNPWFIGGINWETLGCHLHTPDGVAGSHTRPITNVATYISNLIELLLEAGEASYATTPTDHQRSIDISNCGVSFTDFSIETRPDDAVYSQLVRAGERAARQFLAAHRPPTDWLASGRPGR